jgi:hypothetical protein
MTDASATTDPDERVLERYIWKVAGEPNEVHGRAAGYWARSAMSEILRDLGKASRDTGIGPERIGELLHKRSPGFATDTLVAASLRRMERRMAGLYIAPRHQARGWSRKGASPGFANILGLAGLLSILIGLSLDIVGHTQPYPLAPLAVIGPFFIGGGAGITIGSLWPNWIAVLVVSLGVAAFFLAVGYYHWPTGVDSWGL